MKKLLIISVLSLIITIIQSTFINAQTNEVGTLPGAVSVSPSGAATYAIPIDLPPGRAGMTPELALVYNSMNGNSSLGLSWSISGMQSITRGGTNLYFEDAIDGVNFNDNDKYYLNGQRLIKIATNEYRTEQDGFSKIIATGTAGIGPQSFTVYEKNGIEFQFGKTTDSRIEATGREDVLFWRLNRVIDKRGNYVDYKYDETNHLGLISSIEYTGNLETNELPFNSINFIYKERNDNNTFYIYGSSYEQTQLLDKIELTFNGQTVNTYQLTYDETGLNPKLISAQPITNNGSKLNATSFEFGEQTNHFEISFLQNIMHEHDYVMGDFNGDGKSDMICYWTNGNNVEWQVFYADDEGETFIPGETFNETTTFRYFQPGDFNGDDLCDIVIVYSEYVRVRLSEGQQFSYPISINDLNYIEYQDHNFQNIDLNGNGKMEILLVKYNIMANGSYGSNINAFEYNGSSFVSILDEPGPGDGVNIYHDEPVHPIEAIDLNADGKTNILWNNGYSTNSYTIKELAGETLVDLNTTNENFLNSENKVFCDFNRDGISDCFVISQSSVGIHFYDGKGTWVDGPIIMAPGDPGELYHEYYDKKFMIGDFNGDNMHDVVLIFKEQYNPPPNHGEYEFLGTHINTYYSYGSGTLSETTFYPDLEYGFYIPSGMSYYDFNGDGRSDALLEYSDVIRKAMFFHKNEKSNFVHKFINGLGHETNVEYDYLTNSDIYEKGSDAIYPIVDKQIPMTVAVQILSQNDIGDFFESNYSYKNAKAHLRGKGMLGFGDFVVKNNTANIITETKFEIYDQDVGGNPKYFLPYPAETCVFSTKTNDRDMDIKDKLLRKTENTLELIPTTEDGFGFLPIITQSISYTWDNDENHSHIRTTLILQDKTNIDNYGNSTFNTTKVFASTDINTEPERTTETSISYIYDEPNWILNRPITITTTVKTQNNEDYIKKTNYDYYAIGEPGSNGIYGWPLIKSKETIPDNDELYKNTILLEYDKYGNITKKTFKALDLSGEEPYQTIEKVSNFEYDDDDMYYSRFLTKSNIMEGPGYETTYTYYTENGLVASTTDPAGLQTQFAYDDFSRLNLTTYPDGNFTTSLLYWVSESHIDAPEGAVYFTWAKTNGSSVKRVFYNKLGRPMRSTGEGLTVEQKIFVDTKYNDRGFAYKISEPFFAENPPDENDDTKWTTISYNRIGKPYYTKTPTNSYYTSYNGRTTSIRNNSTGITRTSQSNSLGQTVLVNDPSGDIKYTYYSSGQLHTTNALGQLTIISYNPLGNKKEMTEPNSGTYTYKYGTFGELLRQTDENGNITTMQYDGLGRAVNKNVNGNTTNYFYNETPGNNGFGLLKQIIGHNRINYAYEYDGFNRQVNEIKLIDGIKYQTLMDYDNFGRIKTYTYPSNYKIDYLYTSETGVFYKVNDHETGQMLYETKHINQRGQLLNYELGNGLETQKEFNPISGLIENIHTDAVQNLSYNWDHSTGNMLSREDNSYGKSLIETFTYDDVLKTRLASWHVDGQTKYMAGYKNNGNITYKSDVSWPVQGAMLYGTAEDKPNAIQSVMLPTSEYFTEAENPQTIEYTGFNKVSSILQYKNENRYQLNVIYGPTNTRCKTILYKNRGIAKAKYFINSNYEIEQDSEGNSRILHYIKGADGLFAIYEWKGDNKKMYYIHKDHLSSYETITDEDGNLVEKLSFDPWGRRRNPDTWTYENVPTTYLFDRGFTGHEHLDVFGLVNMNGRIYDSWVGSFLSPDPFVQAPSYSQNYNRYSYAFNNPLKYIDPSGYNTGPYEENGTGFRMGGRGGIYYNNGFSSSSIYSSMYNNAYVGNYNPYYIGSYWESTTTITDNFTRVTIGGKFESINYNYTTYETERNYVVYDEDGRMWYISGREIMDNVQAGGGKTIHYYRTTETENSTTGTFSIPGTNISGYFLEPAGPSTTQSGLDRKIPAGTYNLNWHNGTDYQGVLRLSNDQVPASRGVLIHIGNYPSNTSGCLLPGCSIGTDFVGSSGKMLNQILNHYNNVGINGAQIIIYDINYP